MSENITEYKKPRMFISFDVEADGPCVLRNNCIQMGFAAVLYPSTDTEISNDITTWVYESRSWCIKPLPNHEPDSSTLQDFWYQGNNRLIYADIQAKSRDVVSCMEELSQWIKGLSLKFNICEFVAKPASYDWQWLNNYYRQYAPKNAVSLGYKATCISSMIMAIERGFNIDWNELQERITMLDDSKLILHNAEHDAIRQAYSFIKLCDMLTKLKEVTSIKKWRGEKGFRD